MAKINKQPVITQIVTVNPDNTLDIAKTTIEYTNYTKNELITERDLLQQGIVYNSAPNQLRINEINALLVKLP